VRLIDLQQPHPNANPGLGLESCPYPKHNQQKAARIMQHPDRFLFPVFFLILFLLTS
jgi:hypothetical protein